MTKEEELTQYCSEFNCPDYSNCDLCMYNKGRADAIDEIHTDLITEIDLLNATDMTDTNLYAFAIKIKEITDKLKEQSDEKNNNQM